MSISNDYLITDVLNLSDEEYYQLVEWGNIKGLLEISFLLGMLLQGDVPTSYAKEWFNNKNKCYLGLTPKEYIMRHKSNVDKMVADLHQAAFGELMGA